MDVCDSTALKDSDRLLRRLRVDEVSDRRESRWDFDVWSSSRHDLIRAKKEFSQFQGKLQTLVFQLNRGLLVFIVAGFQQFILDPAIPLEEFQLILKLIN